VLPYNMPTQPNVKINKAIIKSNLNKVKILLFPYAAQRREFKFSLRPEFENLLQLFFGAYKLAVIVFRVVFITFDIIDICVLCI